jgi:hypothetical protein
MMRGISGELSCIEGTCWTQLVRCTQGRGTTTSQAGVCTAIGIADNGTQVYYISHRTAEANTLDGETMDRAMFS